MSGEGIVVDKTEEKGKKQERDGFLEILFKKEWGKSEKVVKSFNLEDGTFDLVIGNDPVFQKVKT